MAGFPGVAPRAVFFPSVVKPRMLLLGRYVPEGQLSVAGFADYVTFALCSLLLSAGRVVHFLEVSVNALQAKATARVDVPEPSKTQGYGVFLRTLQGRHHVLPCCADMLVADLHELVADTCHMPCERFMLVHQSKIVQRSGSLGEWGIERDATLSLTLRMLGGSGIPGEWHCALCNRCGCWHTKAWCFRCGTSRAESEAILRGSAQGFALPGKGSAKGKGIGKGVGPQPQREQRYPGRPAPTSGPQFSRAPTFHAPRQNKRKQADSSSPQLNALPQVVEVLKMLGCSQDILDMFKSKVDEQTKAQHQVPGERENAARPQNETYQGQVSPCSFAECRKEKGGGVFGTWPLNRRDIWWRFKTSMIKPFTELWKALWLTLPQVRGQAWRRFRMMKLSFRLCLMMTLTLRLRNGPSLRLQLMLL